MTLLGLCRLHDGSKHVLLQATRDPHAQSFMIRGSGHVVLGAPSVSVQSQMLSWLSQMVDGGHGWHSATVIPPPSN